MPSNFDQAFDRVKQLAADFQANDKFYLSPRTRKRRRAATLLINS